MSVDSIKSIFNEKETGGKIIKDKSINILIAALNNDEILTSLYIFSYEPTTQKIGIIYFPENTLIFNNTNLKKNEYSTIKELYHSGDKSTIRAGIENDLNIKIQYFLGYRSEDFVKSINLIGGLNLKIQNNIKYFDNTDSLWYLLPAGSHDFYGLKILEFLNFNDGKEELFINRKNIFIQRLFDKLNEYYDLEEQLSFLRYLHSFIFFKDIKFDEFKDLINSIRNIKSYDIVFEQLPAQKKNYKDGFAYSIISTKAVDILPKSYANRLNSSKQNSKSITVEIINGTKTKMLAANARSFLQNEKFLDLVDVQIISKSKKIEAVNTIIIDRQGNLRAAQRIREILGCGEVKTEIQEKALVDVTIILGDDFKLKFPEKK